MNERDKFIDKLRKLSLESLPFVVMMPPESVGHPDGTIILKTLLDYIVDFMNGNYGKEKSKEKNGQGVKEAGGKKDRR